MTEKTTIPLFIAKEKQGTYFTLPFSVPSDVESFTLTYRYDRRPEKRSALGAGIFISRPRLNTIDLGLIAPDGTQVGVSGSDKTEITISETGSTPGYRAYPMIAGEWKILVGAYEVASEGVDVTYEITFTPKRLRLLKGDLHTHTLASDGVHTAEELGWKALRNGLDFLAITDHNQMVTPDALPKGIGITFIPGVEWTHYMCHANFLGSEKPYDAPFATNSLDETLERFNSARERGALITINHPFEEVAKLYYDINSLIFDCLEIWNGPMREANLKAVGLWHSMLCAEKKIPITGGSDYHRDTPFIFLGGPTTCVYAPSANPKDILSAIKQGHAFLTFSPTGPTAILSTGEAMMGDSVPWDVKHEMHIAIEGLLAGDVVKVITANSGDMVLQAPTDGDYQAVYTMQQPGFARVEVYRSFLPGLPMLPALITNPIYFEA
jgi:hypothetical protein